MCPFFLRFQQFDYDEPTYGSFPLPCLGFAELLDLGVDGFHPFGHSFSTYYCSSMIASFVNMWFVSHVHSYILTSNI